MQGGALQDEENLPFRNELPSLPISSRTATLLFALMLLLGLAIRLWDFTDPFTTNSHGYNGAFYSVIARNYLHYGFLKTRIAQVVNVDQVRPDRFEYYFGHPPLLSILIAFSFRLFGIHEASVRLVPILFSLGSILLLFLFIQKVSNTLTALVGACLFAFIPMEGYFGSCPDAQSSLVVFFILALFLTYFLYLQTGRKRFLALLLFSFGVGALSDWPVYYAAVFVTLHYLFFRTERKRPFFLLFPLFVLVYAGLYLIYLMSFSKTSASPYGATVFDAFVARTFLLGDTYSFGRAITLVYRSLCRLFTPPVLVGFCLWFLSALISSKRELFQRNMILLFLFLPGAFHVVLFFQGAVLHHFWSRHTSMTLCTAMAILLVRLFIPKRSTAKAGTALLAVSVAALSIFFYIQLRPLYSYGDFHSRFGAAIRRNVASGEGIMTPHFPDLYLINFYADRRNERNVTDIDMLKKKHATGRFRYYVFSPEEKNQPKAGLLNLLDTFAEEKWEDEGFVFYRLPVYAPPPAALPPPPPPSNLRFSKRMFKGKEVLSLEWDEVQSGDLSHYRIYYGRSFKSFPYYRNLIGKWTWCPIGGIIPLKSCPAVVAVTAVNKDGQESLLSNKLILDRGCFLGRTFTLLYFQIGAMIVGGAFLFIFWMKKMIQRPGGK